MNEIKRIRLANGWTQAYMACLMECTQVNIVYYEAGKQSIPVHRALKLIKNAKELHGVILTLDDIYKSPESHKEGV